MRVSLLATLVIATLILSACNPGQETGAALSPSIADANSNLEIKRNADGSQAVCLPRAATQAWGDDSFAGKFIGNVIKGTIDNATAPVIALGGTVALTPTHMFNASTPLYNAARGKSFDAAMPYCGNWCGANHPQDVKSNPQPVDALDNACKSHDLCYLQRGDYDCGCDQQLVQTVLKGRNVFDLSSNEQGIVVLFRSSPCYGGCKTFEGHRICGGRHVSIGGVRIQ